MTQINSAPSTFRATSGEQGLVVQIAQPGTYSVVHGVTCVVCEANAVYVRSFPLGSFPRSGSYTIACAANNASHDITAIAAFSEVPRTDQNDLTSTIGGGTSLQGFAGETISFANPGERAASVEYAESFWPCAAIRGFSDSSQAAFVFYGETVSSSISEEQYVATEPVAGAFISYAGVGKFAAGYIVATDPVNGAGGGSLYFVSLFATYQDDADYLDAKPFHSPSFAVTKVEGAQSFGQGAGQFVSASGLYSGTSLRAGALDRVASAYAPLAAGATAAQERQLQTCDYNGLTLRQRKVERHIFRDSPLFKYDTALEISIKNRTVGSASVSLSGSMPTAQRQAIDDVFAPLGILNSFASAHSDGNCFISFTAHRQSALESGPYTLTHSLHDGRKTMPGEWHFSGASQIQAASFPETNVPPASGYQYDFATEAEATARRDAIENATVWDGSYFAPTVAVTHTPKRAQLRARVFHNTQIPQDQAAVLLDYRFTSVFSAAFFKYPLELVSVSLTPPSQPGGSGLSGRWVVAASYRYGSNKEQLFTRSYLHELYGSAMFMLTTSQWREQAMAGQAVEVSTASQDMRIGLRLISA